MRTTLVGLFLLLASSAHGALISVTVTRFDYSLENHHEYLARVRWRLPADTAWRPNGFAFMLPDDQPIVMLEILHQYRNVSPMTRHDLTELIDLGATRIDMIDRGGLFMSGFAFNSFTYASDVGTRDVYPRSFPVPEPAAWLLVLVGAVMVAAARYQRSRRPVGAR